MKKKILTIIGARPQFIKAAPLSRKLKNSKIFDEAIVHTGQHYDQKMSEVFFQELEMPAPIHNLNISGGSHGEMTGRMMVALDEILKIHQPDLVLVYGDTNTTLAGALTAAKLQFPIAHIEAGLRSYNKKMPEEVNRLIADHTSSILFCPTKNAVNNLLVEGITETVFFVGDLMFDACIHAKKLVKKNMDRFKKKFSFIEKKFLLLTIHREEATRNLGNFSRIFDFAVDFAKKKGCEVIFPAHPRLRTLLKQVKVDHTVSIADPFSYLELQYLLTKASYVLTDSGGLQKEAFFHKVPCITLREETEWKETIEAGWNRLWQNKHFLAKKDISDYGNGNSAEQIISVLEEIL